MISGGTLSANATSSRRVRHRRDPFRQPAPALAAYTVLRRRPAPKPCRRSLTAAHAGVAGYAVYLIPNANKYKYYERWATAHD
eukprot:COSAG03_NODE_22210_length_294_cov_0.574359_1_plen_82_part_10